MSIFEKASRAKLSFESSKGLLTVEQLWDLPLASQSGKANLDDIARELNRKLKSTDDVSFVLNVVSTNSWDQLKFDIVKHIIDTRLAENAAESNRRVNREQIARLSELLVAKQEEALQTLTPEEIQAKIDALRGV